MKHEMQATEQQVTQHQQQHKHSASRIAWTQQHSTTRRPRSLGLRITSQMYGPAQSRSKEVSGGCMLVDKGQIE